MDVRETVLRGGIDFAGGDSVFFAVDKVAPSLLKVVEPCPEEYVPTREIRAEASSGALERLFLATVEICSKWYMAMNSAFKRERDAIAEGVRNGTIPKSDKPPKPEHLNPSPAETAVAEAYCSMVRALFGRPAADYAYGSWLRVISTADRRSFKIRLLVYAFRDSIEDPDLKEAYCEGMDECITEAERIAGCRPDPSPRRMSKAEQAHKKHRDEVKSVVSRTRQLDLFDELLRPSADLMPGECPVEPISPPGDGEKEDADPSQTPCGETPVSGGDYIPENEGGKHASESSGECEVVDTPHTEGGVGSNPRYGNALDRYCNNGGVTVTPFWPNSGKNHPDSESVGKEVEITGINHPSESAEKIPSGNASENAVDNTTRRRTRRSARSKQGKQPSETMSAAQEKPSDSDRVQEVVDTASSLPRKTRDYSSAREISEDIAAGLIRPYEASREIIEDLKNDIIKPLDAALFLAELDKRYSSAPDKSRRRRMQDSRIERMTSRVSIGLEDDADDLIDDDTEEEAEEERSSRSVRGGRDRGEDYGYSNGSYSCSGAEYNPDDNW